MHFRICADFWVIQYMVCTTRLCFIFHQIKTSPQSTYNASIKPLNAHSFTLYISTENSITIGHKIMDTQYKTCYLDTAPNKTWCCVRVS